MPYPAGKFFKRKNQKIPQREFLDFGAEGGQGDMPSASQFLQVSAC